MASDHLVACHDTLTRARVGDREALGDLFRVYQPQVLRLLRAKRALAPEDVASQVWIDVGRSLARFEGDGRAFQRWIFTIADRRAIDELRRAGRRRETSVDDHDVVDPGADPATFDESLESSIELVASLPSQMAEAVMLRIVYDLSVEETGVIMQVTPSNVRVLTHRGLAKLRRQIAGPRHDRSSSVDDVIDVDFRLAQTTSRNV